MLLIERQQHCYFCLEGTQGNNNIVRLSSDNVVSRRLPQKCPIRFLVGHGDLLVVLIK
jgi:hypothetical protein